MSIKIDGRQLKVALDLADAWNRQSGKVNQLDEYERIRRDIVDDILWQQAAADSADPGRDDSKDGGQFETVSDALEAYILGDPTGKRPPRGQIMREIRGVGITITRSDTATVRGKVQRGLYYPLLR